MKTTRRKALESVTGTYAYDKKLGRLVKVSDRVRRRAKPPEVGPCGRSACAGGRCAA